MRAKEFIREFTINVPVTVNIPLADLKGVEKEPEVVNPGVRYGDNDLAKWSPPLQQHLDTMKDGVGITMPDVVDKPTEVQVAQAQDLKQTTGTTKIKPVSQLFVTPPSQPR